jgi:hypothetical protein
MMQRFALGLVLCALACGSQAHSCTPPPSPQRFLIEHELFGEIGHHVIAFDCQGENLNVDVEEAIQVRVALVTAFARTARYHQIWREDRLERFQGHVEDDDGRSVVSARREQAEVVIEGPVGRIEAPGSVVPNYPWRESIAERPLAFDLESGELLHLFVSSAGFEELTSAGRQVLARKLAVRGDRVRELWFDDTGLLKWELRTHGALVTLTRQALTPR